MAKQYTLDEVKNIVYSGNVNTSNLTDIMSSLKDYNFNGEIKDIFVQLSNSSNLPDAIRVNFKNFIDSYTEELEAEPIKITESTDNETGHTGTEEIKVEEKTEEIEFKPVDVVSLPQEEEKEDVKIQEESSISLANDAILGGLMGYATFKGIKVVASNPGLTRSPSISFELDEKSKPYIDNLLLELYGAKEDTKVEMSRIASTGQEVLTIDIDKKDLTQEELQEKGKQMFAEVQSVLENTDAKKDYESLMPDELKALKDKFVNDDPNIPSEDFKVGYTCENGEHAYFLVANSKEEALDLAEQMGYQVREDRGGNVFELDTEGKNMEGTKLEKITEDINSLDEVKDTENGISDVDIDYNNRHYDSEDYKKIEDFIMDGKDPSTMSVVQIDVPDATPNQRVVNLASDDGTRETIVFNNGKEFDNYTLPKIAETYGNGSSIDRENAKKIEYDNGKAGYDALSSDNTYLRMNNFDASTIDGVDNTLSPYMKEDTTVMSNTKTNAYVKSLGSYPTKDSSNEEAAKTSFAILLVFILVMVIGFIVVYLVVGR